MSVLPDWMIRGRVDTENMINPFDSAMLQPSSYDVRLAGTIMRFDLVSPGYVIDPFDQESITKMMRAEVHRFDMSDSIILGSKELILGATMEKVAVPRDLVCRLEGKSSLGRLGLAVHITAGYIDPGFCGAITLEIANLAPAPIKLRPGMPIAQIGFLKMTSFPESIYSGRYQNDESVAASRYGIDKQKEDHHG